MLLRKINAGISLLITFLVLYHAISIAAWMLSKGSIAVLGNIAPWILTGFVALHAFISIDLAISAHSNAPKSKGNSYPKMNRATIIQRATGILIMIFTALHIAGAAGFMQPPKLVHGIVPPLFFIIVLVHVAVSTSKAFITLGIGNAKFVKVVDVISKVICALTLVADIVGFYLYVW